MEWWIKLVSRLAPDTGISLVFLKTTPASIYMSVSAGDKSGKCSILIPTRFVVARVPVSLLVLFDPLAVLRNQLLLVAVQISALNFAVLVSTAVTLSGFTPECKARFNNVSIRALNWNIARFAKLIFRCGYWIIYAPPFVKLVLNRILRSPVVPSVVSSAVPPDVAVSIHCAFLRSNVLVRERSKSLEFPR